MNKHFEYQAVWERVFCDYIADARRASAMRTHREMVDGAVWYADVIVKELAAIAKEEAKS